MSAPTRLTPEVEALLSHTRGHPLVRGCKVSRAEAWDNVGSTPNARKFQVSLGCVAKHPRLRVLSCSASPAEARLTEEAVLDTLLGKLDAHMRENPECVEAARIARPDWTALEEEGNMQPSSRSDRVVTLVKAGVLDGLASVDTLNDALLGKLAYPEVPGAEMQAAHCAGWLRVANRQHCMQNSGKQGLPGRSHRCQGAQGRSTATRDPRGRCR